MVCDYWTISSPSYVVDKPAIVITALKVFNNVGPRMASSEVLSITKNITVPCILANDPSANITAVLADKFLNCLMSYFLNRLLMKPLLAPVLIVTMVSLPTIAKKAVIWFVSYFIPGVGLRDLILSIVIKTLSVDTIMFDAIAIFSTSPFVPCVGFGTFGASCFTYNCSKRRNSSAVWSVVTN
ncbi:hypothetical protein GQX74_013108 [Glossina fuscipes]|nr:hypothetical protein GQX74_013108 [Glossina fuscipes]